VATGTGKKDSTRRDKYVT